MVLQLREIVVGSCALFSKFLVIVIEVESEVEEGCRNSLALHQDMFLGKMESARPDAEGRDILVEPVGLALKACMLYAPVHSVSQIDLALDRAAPCWRV